MKKLMFLTFMLLCAEIFGTEYYVSNNGNDKNDGKSESKAWKTLNYAVAGKSPVKEGDVIWVKAGIYSNQNIVFRVKGSSKSPIKILGYRKNPGDIKGFAFKYQKPTKGVEAPFDSSYMPLFSGQNRSSGTGFYFKESRYLEIRNVQIKNYRYNLMGIGTSHISLENVITAYSGGYDVNAGSGILFNGTNDNIHVKSCVSFDNGGENIFIKADNSIIEDNISVCGDGGDNKWVNTDYYIKWQGDDCIIRNNYVERIGNLGHGGHGIGTKPNHPQTSKNCIIEKNTIINVSESLYFAHSNASNNLIRLNNVKGYKDSQRPTAYVCRDGAHDNVFEQNRSEYTRAAISLWRSREDPDSKTTATGNIFRNNIFLNTFRGVSSSVSGDRKNDPVSENLIENNIFHGNDSRKDNELFRTNNLQNFKNNIFRNNIVINFNELLAGIKLDKNWTKTFNNFYDCNFSVPKGDGNISVNPDFVNINKKDYRLKSTSKLIDKGAVNSVKKDFDNNKRPAGKSHDIGPYEYHGNTTSSVEANAGSDKDICLGGSAKLTASGGDTYKWSNGADTKSITVSPTETTTYTVTVSTGSDSDTDSAIVRVNSVVAEAGSDKRINEGESVKLTASGGDSYLWSTGATTASIEISPESTTTYSVTVKKGDCEDTDQVKVTVDASSATVVANAGSDKDICLGGSVKLTASGGDTYKWSNGADTKSITVSPTETTTYTVTVSTGSDSDTDSAIVRVNSVVAEAGSDQRINEGESVKLTASGGDSYLWSTGATTASIEVSPESTTTYSVTVKKGDCEDTDQVKVTVDASSATVVANAGSNKDICLGGSVKLTASGGDTYKWSNGADTNSITVSPTETTTYTVTVSTGSDSDTDSAIVRVNSVVAEAGSDQRINEGESVKLTASGGDSYLWNTGATTASIEVSPESTTTYSVTVKKGDCEDTDQVKVTVDASSATVVANAGSDKDICLGGSVKLTASGGDTYKWSNGADTKSITVSPTETTTYTVTVSAGSDSDTDSAIVRVNSVVAEAGSDKRINEGESVKLTASGGDSYLWNTGATTASIEVSPESTTTYSVTVKKGDCEDTDQVKVTVDASSATVVANAGSDKDICLGGSVKLTASGGDTYKWSNGADTKSITVSPTETTTYTVTVSAGSDSDTDSAIVRVNSVVAEAGSDKRINEGESVKLTASGGDSYLWNTGATTASIEVSPESTTTYSVTVKKGDCEDTDKTNVIVDVLDSNPNRIPVSAGEDKTICLGDDVTLTGVGADFYTWNSEFFGNNITVSPKRTTIYKMEGEINGEAFEDEVTVFVENCDESNDQLSISLSDDDFLIYPNPSSDIINIEINGALEEMTLVLFSQTGSVLLQDSLNPANGQMSKQIDVSRYSKGIYYVRIFDMNNDISKKIIVI